METANNDDLNTERLIEMSLNLPSVELITDDDIVTFAEDDGGY
ncbi:MAG: hypothetical protein RR557_08675 [Bacilli bacterium]